MNVPIIGRSTIHTENILARKKQRHKAYNRESPICLTFKVRNYLQELGLLAHNKESKLYKGCMRHTTDTQHTHTTVCCKSNGEKLVTNNR